MKNFAFTLIAMLFFISCTGNASSTSDNNKTPQKDNSAELVTQGKMLLEKNGCLACHSITGEKIVGPTFKGLYGSQVTVMTNGEQRTVTADDDYIKTSIYDPDHDIPQGYVAGQMVSYKDQINSEQMMAIILYLKTLK